MTGYTQKWVLFSICWPLLFCEFLAGTQNQRQYVMYAAV